MNIDKQKALDRLKAIEEETKQLRQIINKEDDWKSVTDFESACGYLGTEAKYLLNKWQIADLTLAQINGLKLETCIKAINEEFVLDFDNQNQKKWYNWFERKNSGWSFSGSRCCWSSSLPGSAFYYETEEKARHGAKHFKQYYDIWLGN